LLRGKKRKGEKSTDEAQHRNGHRRHVESGKRGGHCLDPLPTNGSRGPNDIGTIGGDSEKTKVERYEGGNVPGKMIAVYNIRYMTPETLKKTVP